MKMWSKIGGGPTVKPEQRFDEHSRGISISVDESPTRGSTTINTRSLRHYHNLHHIAGSAAFDPNQPKTVDHSLTNREKCVEPRSHLSGVHKRAISMHWSTCQGYRKTGKFNK
jgi:hypothetical protein